jgi:Helix-turn-helix domain
MAEHGYLTPAETADHYRTTEDTLRYWRYSGYGPGFTRAGKHVLYPRAEIERFDRQLAQQAAAARPA